MPGLFDQPAGLLDTEYLPGGLFGGTTYTPPPTGLLDFAGQFFGGPDTALKQMLRAAEAASAAASRGDIAGAIQAHAANPFVTMLTTEGMAPARGLRAFHGSPHDFDRFDIGRIGTGEGAQVFGHGLYFAEDPRVAEAYRRALSPGRGADAVDTASRILEAAGGDKQRALEIISERRRFANVPGAQEWFDEVQRLIESDAPVRGRVYEVNIKASPDELLDWDKPLSQQPEKVRDAVHRVARDPEFGLSSISDDMRGADLRALLNSPVAVQKLREHGVKGIRYLDQRSRASGEGTRNFVVFDDRLIDIIRKYGIAGLTAGLGALAMPETGQAQEAR